MGKRLLLLTALVLSVLRMTADDGVRMETVEIAANETQEVSIYLDDENGIYCLVQFNLYLPQGMELAKDESSAVAYTTPFSNRSFVGVQEKTDSQGLTYYEFYLEDRSMLPFGTGEVEIFTVSLKAGDMIETGEQIAAFRDVVLVDEMAGGPDIEEIPYQMNSRIDLDVSSLGYASFSWPRTLDFTNSGAQAFIGWPTENETLHLEEVSIVPANTGVIVKASQGTYNPQTTDDDADDVTRNKLSSTASGPYTIDQEWVYVLSNLKDGIPGMYPAVLGVNVAQYRAYLAAGEQLAAALPFTEDDMITGIEDVEKDTSGFSTDNRAYNLSGQRVGDNYKGIVIVGGKKIVRK